MVFIKSNQKLTSGKQANFYYILFNNFILAYVIWKSDFCYYLLSLQLHTPYKPAREEYNCCNSCLKQQWF